MKSAEYVASVVQAYRMVLDAPERSRKEALTAAKELLKYSFGRTPTRVSWLRSIRTISPIPGRRGARGALSDRSRASRAAGLPSKPGMSFTLETVCRPAENRYGRPGLDGTGTVFQSQKGYGGQTGKPGEVETPFKFAAGDAVYKVSSRRPSR